MRILTCLLVVLVVGPIASSRTPPGDRDLYLHRLFAAYDSWRMEQFPEEAMRRGDYAHADRITDQSLEAIERRHLRRREFLRQLTSIDRERLNEQDRISCALLETLLGNDVDGHRFRTFLAPIGTRFGPHQTIPQMGDHVRFESVDDYANYLRRLEQVPQEIEHVVERMKLGMREGRVPPRVAMEGVDAQLDALVAPGGLDRLGQPFARVPTRLDADRVAALHARYRDEVLPETRRALERLGHFLRDEYLAACRETIAATEWPDGDAYYAHQLREMTTTDLSARQIHEIGLEEVARIRAEMVGVIRTTDFMDSDPSLVRLSEDELFARFIAYLRVDSRFYHSDPEALLDGYRAICKRVDGHMPKFFGRLPRLPYGVKEVPQFMAARQTTAYYMPGDLRNAEPGWFYANTYALDKRPRYEMIALAMHEAVPGHHHQIAIAKELEDLPEFRRNTYLTAFGEGWALYAERLGLEMGLYEDPYDDFGRLLYEMWRACRLVVDPGMHAMGWSRREAIDFMLRNTALSELNIANEVDRYIAWPGQATGYKIGELKIRELRQRAEDALGDRFDLRAFHDLVLGAGPLPLSLLERRVDDWIRRQQLGPLGYD